MLIPIVLGVRNVAIANTHSPSRISMANDRRSTAGGALTRPTEDEWMQLIRFDLGRETSLLASNAHHASPCIRSRL
jgi:hypothetical protein